MTDNTTIFGTDLATTVDADGNPTRDAAVFLREVFEILTDATKAFNAAKRNLLAGNMTDKAFVTSAGTYAAILREGRQALRALPSKTTARGGATRQSVWVAFFEGVDASLERNMTKADAKALNKRSFA